MEHAFWNRLETFGNQIALFLEDGTSLAYAELARRADAFAAQWPGESQLVGIQAANQAEPIIAFLGCLRAGHPVVLLNEASLADGRIESRFRPNALLRRRESEWHLERGSDEPARLHPELAVLLSTSGTTGEPKLVRLSRENIDSNARSIAQYLGLGPSDRTITSLEFAYSFGMASITSQLSVGGSIILTEHPIVSEAFWDRFRALGATAISLVPYHFELLERLRFESMELPSLRIIGQAGGKLPEVHIHRYEKLARERGFRLFVMYGQTEASPRMAYVPPEDLSANADCIGRPIPGGELLIRDANGGTISAPDVAGELIYRGPNVMLGYAVERADLAKPRDIQELATGDIALRRPNGYFKIVGRLKRFIKLYGLRINLDEVEAQLRAGDYAVYVSGNDDALGLFHTDEIDAGALRQWVGERYGVRKDDIVVRRLEAIPLLSSGKVDYGALRALLDQPVESDREEAGSSSGSILDAFRAAFGERVQGVRDTFASLGGDSLAYVSLMLDLEKKLGYVPPNWERQEIGALERLAPLTGGLSSMPIDSIVRVIALVLILSLHLQAIDVHGGAWTLMMLAGFGAAKFSQERLKEGRAWSVLGRGLARILLIYYVLVAAFFLLLGSSSRDDHPIPWIFLYANFTEVDGWFAIYWFICAYAQVLALACTAWAVPPLRRWFAAGTYRFGYVALAVGLVAAYVAAPLCAATPGADIMKSGLAVVPVFALGWCAASVRSVAAKVMASVAALASCAAMWFFWQHSALADGLVWAHKSTLIVLAASVLTVTWIERVAMPRVIAGVVAVIASSSFFIYLFQSVPLHIMYFLMPLDANATSSIPRWMIGMSAAFALGLAADWFVARVEHRVRAARRPSLPSAGADRAIK